MNRPPLYPSKNLLLGSILEFDSDEIGTMTRAFTNYGDTVRFRFAWMNAVFVTQPDDVQRVFVDNIKNYPKRSPSYDFLRLMLGNGLVTSEGDFWLRQRRIAQPGFHREKIAGFGKTMVECSAAHAETMSGDVDWAEEMMRLTLRIAGLTLFSVDLTGGEAQRFGDALTTGSRYVDYRIGHPFAPPPYVPTQKNREFNAAMKLMRETTTEIIKRRRGGEGHADLLDMLMNAKDGETGEGMSDEQLVDEVVTLLGAGHETTATALTWVMYHLGKNPEVEAKLRRELDTVLQGRLPTADDMRALPYTEAVIKESMRLTPPVWIIDRLAAGPDVLGGYQVKKNDIVMVSPWVIHRHPKLWDEPLVFDPDRFLGERAKRIPKNAYIPFLAGQRKCIGDSFAMLEAVLVLATLVQRLQIKLPKDHVARYEPLVTLRMRDGLPVNVQRIEERVAA